MKSHKKLWGLLCLVGIAVLVVAVIYLSRPASTAGIMGMEPRAPVFASDGGFYEIPAEDEAALLGALGQLRFRRTWFEQGYTYGAGPRLQLYVYTEEAPDRCGVLYLSAGQPAALSISGSGSASARRYEVIDGEAVTDQMVNILQPLLDGQSYQGFTWTQGEILWPTKESID